MGTGRDPPSHILVPLADNILTTSTPHEPFPSPPSLILGEGFSPHALLVFTDKALRSALVLIVSQ